jgi:hypothetical protein
MPLSPPKQKTRFEKCPKNSVYSVYTGYTGYTYLSLRPKKIRLEYTTTTGKHFVFGRNNGSPDFQYFGIPHEKWIWV